MAVTSGAPSRSDRESMDNAVVTRCRSARDLGLAGAPRHLVVLMRRLCYPVDRWSLSSSTVELDPAVDDARHQSSLTSREGSWDDRPMSVHIPHPGHTKS